MRERPTQGKTCLFFPRLLKLGLKAEEIRKGGKSERSRDEDKDGGWSGARPVSSWL